jgi:hypothetical protein
MRSAAGMAVFFVALRRRTSYFGCRESLLFIIVAPLRCAVLRTCLTTGITQTSHRDPKRRAVLFHLQRFCDLVVCCLH